MRCGIGHRRSSNLALCQWSRPAATAQIWPLAWKPTYAVPPPKKEIEELNVNDLNNTEMYSKSLVSSSTFNSSNPEINNSLLSFIFLMLFSTTPAGYGSAQARGWIGAVAAPLAYTTATAMPSVTYTESHSNVGSLTHWVGPGIKPASSWILLRFVTAEPQRELLHFLLIYIKSSYVYCLSSWTIFLH